MTAAMDIIREQLQQLRDREALLFNHKASIKKWCVTLWTAALFFLVTKQNCPGKLASFTIILPLIFIFWFIDSMISATLIHHAKHMMALEKKISKNDDSIDEVAEVFLVSRDKSILLPDKIFAFFEAAFTTETITVFYMSLTIISILAIINLI